MTLTLTKSQKRFIDNLVELSKKNQYEKCIDEWMFIDKFIDNDLNNHCLCGKELKYQYYYINKITGKIIISGKNCRLKLENLEKEKKTKKIKDLCKIFNSNGMKNIRDYDLAEYCKKNFENIIQIFLNEIRKYGTIEELNDYKKYLEKEWNSFLDIKSLIDEIEKLKINIIKKKLEKERIEKERIERLEKERLEKQKIEKERIERLEKEREKNRRERKEKEEDILKKKLISEKYSIYGNSGQTLSWLINVSTISEIKKLLNDGKITNEQYKTILDKR